MITSVMFGADSKTALIGSPVLAGAQRFTIAIRKGVARPLAVLILGLLYLICGSGFAADQSTSLGTNAPMKRIAPGILEIGNVRLHKDESAITFPAVINMTNGLVEYFLVSATGKLHESVLRTDVRPLHIHLAALLLGAKGAQTNLTVQEFDTKPIPGEKVKITVRRESSASDEISAEQLILNSTTNAAMSQGNWVYNGSQTHDGAFIAERDGLIVSIISDPLALVNNPRPGRENDEIWQVNTESVPPLNTAVQVRIQFLKDTEK